MTFEKTSIDGLFIVTFPIFEDNRGYFSEVFHRKRLKEELGLDFHVAQTSEAFNTKRGIIRGMHFQLDDAVEMKIVRATSGKIFDVVVDVRPDSPSFKKWFGLELTEENRKALIIPAGAAHGYQTLSDTSLVQYHTDNFYSPDKAVGYRYNDPAFGIEWPLENPILSERDLKLPLLNS